MNHRSVLEAGKNGGGVEVRKWILLAISQFPDCYKYEGTIVVGYIVLVETAYPVALFVQADT